MERNVRGCCGSWSMAPLMTTLIAVCCIMFMLMGQMTCEAAAARRSRRPQGGDKQSVSSSAPSSSSPSSTSSSSRSASQAYEDTEVPTADEALSRLQQWVQRHEAEDCQRRLRGRPGSRAGAAATRVAKGADVMCCNAREAMEAISQPLQSMAASWGHFKPGAFRLQQAWREGHCSLAAPRYRNKTRVLLDPQQRERHLEASLRKISLTCTERWWPSEPNAVSSELCYDFVRGIMVLPWWRVQFQHSIREAKPLKDCMRMLLVGFSNLLRDIKTLKSAPSEEFFFSEQEREEKARDLMHRPTLNFAINMVNSGNHDKAIELFSDIIKKGGPKFSAFVGRGTAHAMRGDFQKAFGDYLSAISERPLDPEGYRRLGQACLAHGDGEKAATAYSEVLEISPNDAEALLERGMAYSKAKWNWDAAKDFKRLVQIRPTDSRAWRNLAQASTAGGNLWQGVAAYRRFLALDPTNAFARVGLGQVFKEFGQIDKAEALLREAIKLEPSESDAYRQLAQLKHSQGSPREALEVLREGLEKVPLSLDLRYLEASYLHAMGLFSEAVKKYDEILGSEEMAGQNDKHYVESSFYQREVACFTAMRRQQPLSAFRLDQDLQPTFKEAWGKKLPPLSLFPGYEAQPVVATSLLPREEQGGWEVLFEAEVRQLLKVADRLGSKSQYWSQGFAANKRQFRMAGLAAIEIGQLVQATLRRRKEAAAADAAGDVSLPSDAAAAATAEGSRGGGGRGRRGRRGRRQQGAGEAKGWRDAFDVSVRWRQISDPIDSVVWIDLLTEKEFAEGFGSVTAISMGQAKNLRYYAMYPRAFDIVKDRILVEGVVWDAFNNEVNMSRNLDKVASAANAVDIVKLVGGHFWVVTPCYSEAFPGVVYNGTRLTMVFTNGHVELAIKTPGTPSRWAEYDREMTAAWEELLTAIMDDKTKEVNLALYRLRIHRVILRMAFYWYNFMPLSRGTAMTGYVTMLGLFLAADMEVVASIPPGFQLDWEGILNPHFQTFFNRVSPWLLPTINYEHNLKSLPLVKDALPTILSVFNAMNFYDEDS